MSRGRNLPPEMAAYLLGFPQNQRFCGKRNRNGMNDFSRLRGKEWYEVCGDEAGNIPGEMEALCSFFLPRSILCRPSLLPSALVLACGAWWICWRATDRIILAPMLMCHKVAYKNWYAALLFQTNIVKNDEIFWGFTYHIVNNAWFIGIFMVTLS